MIKNLIFDFGKVLVDYDFGAFFRSYIADPKRLAAFTPVLYNEELQQMLDREARPFDEIMEEIIERHKEFEPEIRYFNDHYAEIVTHEVAGMRELLTRLKAEGYKLYGLTNWCSKVHTTIAQFDIFKLLDGYVISSEEHAIKPEPAIYECLFSRFGLHPEECIFTDDRAENIEGGRQMGMEGIVFHNAQQYERDLRTLLGKSPTEKPLLNEHNKAEYPPAHSAEHLLNQTMVRMFGCERSRNAHIERKKSKINYELPQCPTAEQIAEVERKMNELIAADLPVTYEFVTRDGIPQGVTLDKLPEDASATLRIVRIGDYDVCACIGSHVEKTGEIGTFKITSTSYKDGSFRIVFKVKSPQN